MREKRRSLDRYKVGKTFQIIDLVQLLGLNGL